MSNLFTYLAAPHSSACGTGHQFAALQRFRQLCEGTGDEEWTSFKRHS